MLRQKTQFDLRMQNTERENRYIQLTLELYKLELYSLLPKCAKLARKAKKKHEKKQTSESEQNIQKVQKKIKAAIAKVKTEILESKGFHTEESFEKRLYTVCINCKQVKEI